MNIPASIADIAEFVRQNDDLIEQIRGTASEARDQLRNLSDQLEKSRKQAEDLIGQMKVKKPTVSVGATDELQKHQRDLLLDLEKTRQEIEAQRADPTLVGLLHGRRAQICAGLANLKISEAMANLVTFSTEEVAELNELLKRATLDAVSRQSKAALLDSAVQLAKLGLQAAKLAVV